MKSVTVALIYHFILPLLLNTLRYTTCTKWAVATDDKCVFTVSGNWTILFEVHPSLFVTYLEVTSPSACRTSCCQHHSCNGYVYDSSNQQDSCKLLKCSRAGLDCKDALVKYNKDAAGEVGFITGLADNSEESSSHNKESTSDDKTPEQHERPALYDDSDKKEAESKDSEGISTDGEENGGSESTATTALEEEDLGPYNLTEYGNRLQEFREDIKEHTNSISLTIAFLFGIGFLVTVLYLTGRRWVEGLKEGQQKGYTRISYLLNGV